MSGKEQLIVACDGAGKFPQNLTQHGTHDHTQRAYTRRLDERDDQLFCRDGGKTQLHMLEYDERTKRLEENSIPNIAMLKQHFSDNLYLDRPDSKCTYIFITAPHSRERLHVSRRMFTYVLSYFQTMASFLDFVFPFGRQAYAQDFHFSGFRYELNLTELEKGLAIPELNRSGQDFKLCYSLKSVEESLGQKEWPWSIRQASIHLSFDVVSGVTSWIVVKANHLIKERVQAAAKPESRSDLKAVQDPASSFAASLATHHLLAKWSSEEWRWYISFLEEEFHSTTRRALAVKVETIRSPTIASRKDTPLSPLSSPATGLSEKATFKSQRTMSSFISRLPERPVLKSKKTKNNQKVALPPLLTSLPLAQSPIPTGLQPPFPFPGVRNASSSQTNNAPGQQQFSFESLQRIQSLEDKSNEVLLILDANVSVLIEMTSFYKFVVSSGSCPKEYTNKWSQEVLKFERKIESVISEIRMQSTITKTLLRLLADRKNLLYGILEYQSMEASKFLAEKAQQSAENMETMTRDMNVIAVKTKQETVSMRIITLVTLFFLPGTFISTVMSTDIVHWARDSDGKTQKSFQLPALEIYLIITLPLMVLTFIAWYGVYLWVDRKGKKGKEAERCGQVEEV